MNLELDIKKSLGIIKLKPPKVETSVSLVAQDSAVPGKAARRWSESSTDSGAFRGLDSRYQKWCLSLETQRHYYYTKFGKTHRKDTKAVKKDLMIKNQELDMIELMKKEKAPLYRDCMNELKEVLKKRRENEK